MRHTIISTSLVLTALVAGSACRREPAATDDKSADLAARLAKVEARLDAVERRGGRPAAGAQAQGPHLDPNTVYAVSVAADDTMHGPADAKVTIVEAYEFACPYCAMLAPVMSEVADKHPQDLRIVSKQFVVHPQLATLPAIALCAATQQGKGQAFVDAMWKHAWPAGDGGQPHLDQTALQRPALEAMAKDLGLDAGKFGADLDGAPCKAKVENNRNTLATLGVNGTPTLFINGKPYQGQRTTEAISAAVEAEAKRVDDLIARGTPAKDVYASLIKNGKTTP